MRISLKRGLAGAMALAATATVVPVIAASPASAATNNVASGGTISMTPSSGSGSTTYNLSLTGPGGTAAVCPGDNPAGYYWSTFIIPKSADIDSTLSFSGSGAVTAVAGEFRNNLYSGSTAVRNKFPDISSATITGIPTMSFNIYSSSVTAGEYNIGIACHNGAGLQTYWAKPITVTQTGGVMAWAQGAVAASPTITSATGGDHTVDVAFTPGVSDPAATDFAATLTPTGSTGGSPIVQTGSGSPINFVGVPYGTYDATVTATNSVGTSAPSAAVAVTVSPDVLPAPTSLAAAVLGGGAVDLTWTAPTGPAPTGYDLVVTGPTGSTQSPAAGATSFSLTGLATGSYTATLTPLHDAPFVAAPATVSFTVFPNSVVVQEVEVTRPLGALVLTQVCGSFGALAEENTPSMGFPDGLPAAPAVNSSSVGAPTTTGTKPAGETNGKFAEYPYPTNAQGVPVPTYPTSCGIDLGNAEYVTRGAGAGQFFAADGRLNQITVVNTQDLDSGWNVTGQVSDFTSGPSKSFSGSQLGWTPSWTDDTGSFTDSLGNTYDMTTAIGDPVAPNSPVATGLSGSGRTLIRSDAFNATTNTGSLGTAIADARLKLLIPVTAQSGTYTATLTISAL